MKPVAIAALATLILAGTIPGVAAFADEATPRERFLADLKQAIVKNDTAWLAGHIDYPMTVRGKKKLVVRSASQVQKGGAALFIGPKLRADVLSQKPADLFSNWQGMMIGSGDHNIWAHETASDPEKPDYRMFSINGGN